VRLLVLVFALVFLLGSPALVPAPSVAAAQQVDEEGDTLDAFVDEVVAAANGFWRASFRDSGRAWRDPKVVRARADRRIRSQCGSSRGADHSYCPLDETIFIDWDSDEETPRSEMTHCTPEQRVQAYLTGFQARSLAACALP